MAKRGNHEWLNNGKWWQWLGLLLVLLILIGVSGLFVQLRRGSRWDGQRRLTIALILSEEQEEEAEESLVRNSTMRVISIEPRIGGLGKSAVLVVNLPGEVKMRIARGYGDYLVSAIYGLAVQEGKMNLVTETLQNELGIAVEGYLVTKENYQFSITNNQIKIEDKQERFEKLKKEAEGWWRVRGVKSSLGWGDRLKLWWALRNLRYDQVEWLDFSEGNWAREEQEIDGQIMIWFDKNAIDVRLPDLVSDSQIEDEGLEIRIVNTTQINGLSRQIARIVGSMGMRVVELTDNETSLEKCLISANLEDKKSYSIKRLVDVFGCDIDEQNLDDSRVDIEMQIGKQEGKDWLGS